MPTGPLIAALLWGLLLLLPVLAEAQDKDKVAPALHGQIKYRPVDDFPGRSYDSFGVCEEIRYWLDPEDGEGPDAVIAWYAQGATVYPVIGTATLVTIGDQPGKFCVAAARRDLGRAEAGRRPAGAQEGADKPKSGPSVDLKYWLREQVAALPKLQPEPPADAAPKGIEVPKELRAELLKLDGLRKGPKTPFAELDERGKTLLEKYPGANERGQIYYMLAHVHAQSGMVHPERIVEYSKKALDGPLEALQVPRMYVYWGDAVRISKAREAKGPPAERRKWSAVIYLAGLREVLRYKLPAKVVQPPPLDRGLVRNPPPGKEEEARQLLAKHVAAQNLAYFQDAMKFHRDVLTRQLASLYYRPVRDAEELEAIAAGVLRDPGLQGRFMRAVKGGKWEE
jgi:hypothetical protein